MYIEENPNGASSVWVGDVIQPPRNFVQRVLMAFQDMES